MSNKGRAPSLDFIDKIPEIVPVSSLGTENIILFPTLIHTGLILEEHEIRAGYLRWIKNSPYIIFSPRITNRKNLKIDENDMGLLGKVVRLVKEKERYSLGLIGLLRVKISIVSKTDNLILARWIPLIDSPLPPGMEQSQVFLEELKNLKDLFYEFLNHLYDEFTASDFMQNIKRRVDLLNAENISFVLDGVMNLLNHTDIRDENEMDPLILPSLLIFRETNLLTRLGMVTQLLYSVLHGNAIHNEEVQNSSDSPKKNGSLTSTELANIILGDDSVENVHSEENSEEVIDIPEEIEPPSILRLKEYLSRRVIGQDRAIRTIVRAFNLMKAGFNTPSRPLLVVFFAGPTGVGKTEMAYALSDFLWVSEKNALKESKKKGRYVPFNEKEIIEPPIIEVDCGEFAGSLSHGVSNLIGSPAGYVGSKGTGKGAQPPVFNPQNFPKNRIKVLLLDEIEKAFINSRDNGAEIMGVLMKILDKGKLVNNWEEEVDFTRTIIIFTSNIGSVEIMKSAEDPKIGFGAGIKRKDLSDKAIEQLNEKIYDVTKREYEKLFRPEFRNRINRFIAFHFLSSAEYIAIIKKEFAEIVEKRARELGFAIELSTEILDWFLNEIKGEEGVRKLRDFMQKEISEPIAKAYNLKKLKAGKTYIVKIKAVPVPNDKDKVEMKAYFVVKSSSGGS